MRRVLLSALVVTLTAAAFVTWKDREGSTPALSKHSGRVFATSVPLAFDEPSSTASQSSATPLQPKSSLAPALRDFMAPPMPIAQPAPVAPVSPIATAPQEFAPPPNVRFLGSFTAPSGQLTLYLSHHEQDVEAKVGEALPNGYVVESATAEAVHLVYPRLGTKVIVPAASE